MENKINIAELLKDCPKGMELYSTMYEDVYFDYVDELNIIHCYIQCENYKTSITFNQYGTPNSDIKSKCVIFPKGKTTWEGFVPPCGFKDGDVVISDYGNIHLLRTKDSSYCSYRQMNKNKLDITITTRITVVRLATEEEKAKLFQAIKDNGYKWNTKTKTLEKLIKPNFKVGDRIKSLYNCFQYDIKELTDTHYTLVEVGGGFKYTVPISEDKNWELYPFPNKFDINTLKPFDNCKYSLDGGRTWKFAQYWYIQDKYDVNEIEIDLLVK